MLTVTDVQAALTQPMPDGASCVRPGLGAQSGSPLGSTTGCRKVSKPRVVCAPMTTLSPGSSVTPIVTWPPGTVNPLPMLNSGLVLVELELVAVGVTNGSGVLVGVCVRVRV